MNNFIRFTLKENVTYNIHIRPYHDISHGCRLGQGGLAELGAQFLLDVAAIDRLLDFRVLSIDHSQIEVSFVSTKSRGGGEGLFLGRGWSPHSYLAYMLTSLCEQMEKLTL